MRKSSAERTLWLSCWAFLLLFGAVSAALKAQPPAAAPSCSNPCRDFRPSSGLGQFDVRLAGDTLKVELKVAYSWRNGDPDVVRGYPPAEYEWTDEARDQFEQEFASRVARAWSEEALKIESADGRRRIKVEVRVVTTPLGLAHWRLEVIRNPKDGPDLAASVCYPGTTHIAGDCEPHNEKRPWGTVSFASSHLQDEHISWPKIPAFRIAFPLKSAEVPELRSLTPAWLAAKPEWRILLTGFADRDEVEPPVDRNAVELARERSANLSAALLELACFGEKDAALQTCTDGFWSRLQVRNLGASEDDPDSSSSFVRIEMFNTSATDTLIHEAGHLLGLGDEAVTDGHAPGSPLASAEYAAHVAWYTDEVVTRNDDDGIMSRGKEVRPWHYAPFLEALEVLTGTPGWRVQSKDGGGIKSHGVRPLQAIPRLDRSTALGPLRAGSPVFCELFHQASPGS